MTYDTSERKIGNVNNSKRPNEMTSLLPSTSFSPDDERKSEESKKYKYGFSLASLVTTSLFGAIMNECWLFTSLQTQMWVGASVFVSALGILGTLKLAQYIDPNISNAPIDGGLLGSFLTTIIFTAIIAPLYALLDHSIISADTLIKIGTGTVAFLSLAALIGIWKYRKPSEESTIIKILKSGLIGFVVYAIYLDSLGFANRYDPAGLMRFINDVTFNKLDPEQLTALNVNVTGAVVGVVSGVAAIVASSTCWAGKKATEALRYLTKSKEFEKKIASDGLLTAQEIINDIAFFNKNLCAVDRYQQLKILDSQYNYIPQEDLTSKTDEAKKIYAHTYLLSHMSNLMAAGHFIKKLKNQMPTVHVTVDPDSDDEVKSDSIDKKKSDDFVNIKIHSDSDQHSQDTNKKVISILDSDRGNWVAFLEQIRKLYPAIEKAAQNISDAETEGQNKSSTATPIKTKLAKLKEMYKPLIGDSTKSSGSLPKKSQGIIDQLISKLCEATEVVDDPQASMNCT